MAVAVSPRRRGADKKPRKQRTDGIQPPRHVGPGADPGLSTHAVKAIKALRHGIPEGTPEDEAELAAEAFGTVVDVMRGDVRLGTRDRLSAATYVHERIVGKASQRHEHTGDVTIHVSTGINAAPSSGEGTD